MTILASDPSNMPNAGGSTQATTSSFPGPPIATLEPVDDILVSASKLYWSSSWYISTWRAWKLTESCIVDLSVQKTLAASNVNQNILAAVQVC